MNNPPSVPNLLRKFGENQNKNEIKDENLKRKEKLQVDFDAWDNGLRILLLIGSVVIFASLILYPTDSQAAKLVILVFNMVCAAMPFILKHIKENNVKKIDQKENCK